MADTEDKRRKATPDFAKGLLGDMGDDDYAAEGDEDEDDTDDVEHSGLQQASREMLDAAKSDDHEAHAAALSNFLTIHGKSEKKAPNSEPEDD